MRFNRGTLTLLLASVIVIVAVLVVNNNQANAPAAETPAAENSGPLFPDLTADKLVSVAVKNTDSGDFIDIARDTNDNTVWTVTGPADSADRTVDQTAAGQAITDTVGLAADSGFDVDNLADFGLDNPSYIIELDTGETTLNIIYVGSKNPTGNRYYVMTRNLDVAPQTTSTPSGPDLAGGKTVLLVNNTTLEKVTNLITTPPFEPLPTATATPTATLNPMSEVEMATATAAANATATVEMQSALETITAQPENTAEATAEVTTEATVKATTEATTEPTAKATAEATAEVTTEATAEVTTEATPAAG